MTDPRYDVDSLESLEDRIAAFVNEQKQDTDHGVTQITRGS